MRTVVRRGALPYYVIYQPFSSLCFEIKIKKSYNSGYKFLMSDLNNRKMKIKLLVLFLTACFVGNVARAQEEEISDEDLKKYAVAMDSIENMKSTLIETISDMVKSNENVSASRYNDLSKIVDDEAKLQEAEATQEEIDFVKSVAAKKEEETAKINEAFQSLARDYIGAKTYNAVKKALKDDADLKAKYTAMMEELSKEDTEDGGK